MNWLDHENSPRKRPPLSHGVQSIARVQPLVPEVSMWMSSHGILDESVEEPVQREGEPTVCPEPQKLDGAFRSLVVQPQEYVHRPHLISPGKVESPSQSNADSKECEDVLDQLQRACMRGSSEKAINRERASDSVGDTMSRLRNLGISFVDRNHLKEGQVPETRFDSDYPLGLKALGETHFSTVQSIASDSSLAINSAALKYLDDRQLTALANNRGTRLNGAVDSAMRDSGVTQYGLPMQQLSMHTKNYLENATEASSRPREGRKDILENLTQLLQQPKLRP
ncbi:hypothetical protein TCAL_16860 [Tigriopus californicus]|uniref:Uncharacterized protein n=1 Tax=Tigriopus californicus TaxID=6832 RepID=A0A553P9P3_TIGCA|nr:hypothetical protein TCAL_16860 [Tigriopus californicus]